MSDVGEQLGRLGVNSVRAGADLLEGVVESGRRAVGEVEEGLKRRDEGESAEVRVIVDSVARGYLTFFREMIRTAEEVAEHYRSDSGKLVRKPRRSAESRSKSAAEGGSADVEEAPAADAKKEAHRASPDDDRRDLASDLADEVSRFAGRLWDAFGVGGKTGRGPRRHPER